MNKIISIVVLVVTCETVSSRSVSGNHYFSRLFNQETDGTPVCAKKTEKEIQQCYEEKSGLSNSYVPDINDHKTYCCGIWVTVDCTAEKAKAALANHICTETEYQDEFEILEAVIGMESHICQEYKYKPNTYSHCKPQ